MEVMTMLEAFEQDDPESNFGSMETSALSDFDLKRLLCYALRKRFWERIWGRVWGSGLGKSLGKGLGEGLGEGLEKVWQVTRYGSGVRLRGKVPK